MPHMVQSAVARDRRHPAAEPGGVTAELPQVPGDLQPRLRGNIFRGGASLHPQVADQARLDGPVEHAERVFVAVLRALTAADRAVSSLAGSAALRTPTSCGKPVPPVGALPMQGTKSDIVVRADAFLGSHPRGEGTPGRYAGAAYQRLDGFMPGSESRKPQTGSDLLSAPARNDVCRALGANSTGFGGGDPGRLADRSDEPSQAWPRSRQTLPTRSHSPGGPP
jgi:hypothetical protein